MVSSALAMTLACLAPAAGGGDGPALARHEGPLEKALAAAAEAEKTLLVEFHKSEGGACERSDREVVGDPAVVAILAEKYVVYRVEDGAGEEPALAERFGVREFPTFLFLDGEGNELERQAGAVGKAFLLEMVGEIADGLTVRALRTRVEQHSEDAGLQSRLGKRLALHDDEGARVHLERAVELDPRGAKASTAEARLLLDALDAAKDGTVPPMRAFLERWPDSGLALRIHRALVAVLNTRKDWAGQVESCEVILRRAPGAEARNGLAWALSRSGKEAERALALVDEALKERPDVAAFLDTRAECLSRLGRHDEALEVQRKAMALLGTSAPKETRAEYEDHLREMEKRQGGDVPK
jgi:tetratricopeptide (TPR) repeat protein